MSGEGQEGAARHVTGFELEVPEGYAIERIGSSPASSPEAVIAFWEREQVVDSAEARRRAQEIRLVAVHRGDRTAGAFTAYIDHNAQLRMDMWYLRAYVGREHRKTNIAHLLAMQGSRILEQEWVDGTDTRAAGTIMEVENRSLRERYNFSEWLTVGNAFIGVNRRGDHVRVAFFPGAVAPPPPGR